MSLHTRWLRFHSPLVRFPASQLRGLVEVDHVDRSVLLAEVKQSDELGDWQVVGFAQYTRGSGDRAEAAIAIEDAWQGRGIGTVLARQLARAAWRAGIGGLTGEVLAENQRMLRFIRTLAPRVQAHSHGTTVELTYWLDPALRGALNASSSLQRGEA